MRRSLACSRPSAGRRTNDLSPTNSISRAASTNYMRASLKFRPLSLAPVFWLLFVGIPCVQADVGDPQIRTDHPWYPGELACSTFVRLFATEAEQYERATGTKPTTDEQKALAA